jgi:hypothetical protein
MKARAGSNPTIDVGPPMAMTHASVTSTPEPRRSRPERHDRPGRSDRGDNSEHEVRAVEARPVFLAAHSHVGSHRDQSHRPQVLGQALRPPCGDRAFQPSHAVRRAITICSFLVALCG